MSIVPIAAQVGSNAVGNVLAPAVAQASDAANILSMAAGMARAARETISPAMLRRAKAALRRSTRRQKVHQRNRIGMRPGTSGAKKDAQLTSDLVTYDDCALNYIDITNIDKTTTNAINGRQGNACYFSGVKLHMRVYNALVGAALNLNPIKFHIAVVSPVRGKTIADDGWFRDYVTSRDKNFTTTLNEIEYDDPINSDKYLTHWKRSFTIGALKRENNSTANVFYDASGGQSWRELDEWIPIKRNLRFNDDTNEDCETPVFMVWWAKVMSNTPGQAINSYKASMRLVSFFHESLPDKRVIRYG